MAFSYVQIGQKGYINDLSDDISSATQQIQSTEDLNKLLTVQNQLSLLPTLHQQKPETSRVFDYVTFVSPKEVKVPSLTLNIESSTMQLSGVADSIATVNKFVDNLKVLNYFLDGDSTLLSPVFSQVTTQLSGSEDQASYTVDLAYDPLIFDNTLDITLELNGETGANTAGEEE